MRVFWSQLAEDTYFDNLEYLFENWSQTVVLDFIKEVEETMNLLEDNPDIFRWWDSKKHFKVGYINKHISFYYSFNKQVIQVHFFWSKHKDPEQLKKYIGDSKKEIRRNP